MWHYLKRQVKRNREAVISLHENYLVALDMTGSGYWKMLHTFCSIKVNNTGFHKYLYCAIIYQMNKIL